LCGIFSLSDADPKFLGAVAAEANCGAAAIALFRAQISLVIYSLLQFGVPPPDTQICCASSAAAAAL